MTAIAYSATIASLYFFISTACTGFLLYTLLRKKHSDIANHTEEAILISISAGFLFNSLMFLLTVFSVDYDIASQEAMVIGKYTIDTIALIATASIIQKNWNNIYKKILSIITPTGNICVFTLAIFVGITSLIYFPHTLDSSQLLWTMKFIAGVETSTINSTGAFGYSSLLYYPFYFVTDLPLVTLAAGYKIALIVLLALAVIYMVNTLGFSHPNIVKPAYFLIIISSFYGQVGLMELGKDSILGVLFSMLYITSIIRMNKDETGYIVAAIFFSAAIISGVITIPYMLLFTGIYLLINSQNINVFLFLYWLALFSTAGLSVALNSMMKLPILPIFLTLSLFVIASFSLRNRAVRIPAIIHNPMIKYGNSAYITILIVILVGSYLLMPVKVGIIAWTDALGNAVVDYRSPLDGEMSFTRFMLKFEPYLLKLISILGLIGFFIIAKSKKWREVNSLYALALFPLSMVFLVLIMSHLPIMIFSGFNLWDMMRDIPLWYGAIIYGLFSLILIEYITSISTGKGSKVVLIALLALSLQWGYHLYKVASKRHQHLPHYTETGGHINKYFSGLTEFLFKTDISVNNLYISKTSKSNPHFYSFQMYSFITPLNINTGNTNEIDAMTKNLPAFFIGGLSDLVALQSHKDITLDIKELQFFDSSNESIYLLTESEEFTLEKTQEITK